MVDTQHLERAINRSGYRKAYLAKRCGISRQLFYAKLHNKRDFTAAQVAMLCALLDIVDPKEKEAIFFD